MRILFLLLISFLSTAFAGDKSDWPSGSAMYEGFSQKEILEKKQSKANELILKIQSNLEDYSAYKGEYLARVFKDHHDSWEKYVDSTCMAVGVMTGSGGSWPSYYALRCENNMTDQRLFNLTNTLQCIKRHTKNKRNYEIPACLYQSYTVKY